MGKKLNPVHPVHPGEVLDEEFLKPFGLSQSKLALGIGVHPRRINENSDQYIMTFALKRRQFPPLWQLKPRATPVGIGSRRQLGKQRFLPCGRGIWHCATIPFPGMRNESNFCW